MKNWLQLTKRLGLFYMSIGIAYVALTASLFAVENDQYPIWGLQLKDSGSIINEYFTKEFNKVITHENRGLIKHSCNAMVFRIGWHFVKGPLKKTDMWADSNPLIDKFPLLRQDMDKDGIYRDIPKKRFSGRSISVNGINIGVDKLSHAFVVGYFYWIRYRLALKKYLRHHPLAKAEKMAIDIAIRDIGIGMETKLSAMVGYSDLEANFQGFLIYKNLCEGTTPTLKFTRTKKWMLTKQIDFKKTVTPYYNEIFYPNFHKLTEWKLIEHYLNEYCTRGQEPNKIMELKRYKKIAEGLSPSYSLSYINTLIDKGILPDPKPQRLDNYCASQGIDTFLSLYPKPNLQLRPPSSFEIKKDEDTNDDEFILKQELKSMYDNQVLNLSSNHNHDYPKHLENAFREQDEEN
ncbi:MAG: hypothetical protein HQK51_16030 [Oligoflexia bacterium]|nr:hypothetical protein [Oligoflexia bacterium]